HGADEGRADGPEGDGRGGPYATPGYSCRDAGTGGGYAPERRGRRCPWPCSPGRLWAKGGIGNRDGHDARSRARREGASRTHRSYGEAERRGRQTDEGEESSSQG